MDFHAIARTIYPQQYFSLSSIVAFPSLPHEINTMIHSYRDINEVHVEKSHVLELLGTGKTLRRDCLLLHILRGPINDVQITNMYAVMQR